MNESVITLLTWIGIVICISQSAMFSGMNLALFSISRLRLEVEAAAKNPDAVRLLKMRKDSNYLLTTVLWGNVSINVLLTLLSNSVLTGVSAFLFSTFVITFIGEIFPQAYFSRNALRMASRFAPLLTFYQYALFPFTKSSAYILDRWLGSEGIQFFREHNLREVIKKHIEADEAEIDRLEGLGALNFLAIDDLMITEEGETVDPCSIIALPTENNKPVFPDFSPSTDDPFLKQIQRSGKKWVILTDKQGAPKWVLDADGFLRHVMFKTRLPAPHAYCHRPILIEDAETPLGDVLCRLKASPGAPEDDIINQDVILFWGGDRRIITGSDILGRLMRGISGND